MTDLFSQEIERAHAILIELGGNPQAFHFRAQVQHTEGTHDSTRRNVTVLYGDQRKHYQCGYTLDWVDLFELDLWRGAFGEGFRFRR